MNKIIFKLQKYKFYIVVALVVVAALIVINAIDSRSNEAATYNDGYTEITSVPGVVFDVQKSYADSSQAVLEISKKVSFLDYQTYSYKNGTDTYLLFNIKKMIVIVKKGTEFKLENGTDSLKKKSLNGIWFTPNGSVNKSGKKAYVDVSAEVIITNDIFNDFNGRLCTITDNGIEYALFVGTSDKDVIEHITDSFKVSSANNEEYKDYVVDMETDEVSVIEEPQIELPSSEEADEPAIIETPVDEDVESDVIEVTPEDTAPIDAPVIEVIEPVIEEQTEVITEESEADKEPVEVKEPAVKESESNKEETSGFHIDINQKSVVKEAGKAYSSNIYSMLNIGDMGFAMTKDGKNKYETVYIKAEKVLNNEEALNAVNKHIASGKSYYSSFDVPKGSHLEAIEYSVKYEGEKAYLNSYLKGVDGEDLRHNGLTYSHRTYDILSDKEKDGWITNNIVFYIVPNGCTEYVIQFGEGQNEEKCYYHIKN